ncbi:MAG: rod shape-determining protein RodA, partial [Aquificae bacterium]|nr:rod shape-determining protein RodA [Aquificota bacterium]
MIKRFLQSYDWLIIGATIFLIFWSVLNIYSATLYEGTSHFKKQAFFGIIGILIIFLLPLINYKKLVNLSVFIYLIGVGLLVAVMFIGATKMGAKRWINLGFFSIQPSEFMKFVMILVSAYILGQNKEKTDLKTVLILLIFTAIPFILIVKQPDLGTAIAMLIPVAGAIFVSGLDRKIIIGATVGFIASLPLIWQHLKDYQKERIIAFLNPEADPFKSAYHILQSKIAVGSGQLTGKGFLKGTQSKFLFLPEQHTDFIFATIGEEWGFVVSALIVFIYFLIGTRMIYWSFKVRDIEGKLICVSAATLIITQAFINIAMNIGLAPVVGI